MQTLGIKRYLQNEAYPHPRFNSSLIIFIKNNENKKMQPSCIGSQDVRVTLAIHVCSLRVSGGCKKMVYIRCHCYVCGLPPRLVTQTNLILVLWAIGNGRLNTSPKLGAYTSIPSTPSSMAALFLADGCLFSGKASSLDAFRTYPRQLSCSACPVGQLINQRLRCPVPLVLGATSPQTTTPLSGRDRPVSRRSKPSSRSPLMGEQPHPWLLLQNQDGKSRHRGTKPRGRWELSPATSLLSLG